MSHISEKGGCVCGTVFVRFWAKVLGRKGEKVVPFVPKRKVQLRWQEGEMNPKKTILISWYIGHLGWNSECFTVSSPNQRFDSKFFKKFADDQCNEYEAKFEFSNFAKPIISACRNAFGIHCSLSWYQNLKIQICKADSIGLPKCFRHSLLVIMISKLTGGVECPT